MHKKVAVTGDTSVRAAIYMSTRKRFKEIPKITENGPTKDVRLAIKSEVQQRI